jgi:phage host-nuclease inhibitor protein Gam
MVNEEFSNEYEGVGTQVKDIEERQRVLKDRTLLLGQNLIEIKEKQNIEIQEIKKDIETLKQITERVKSFLETLSSEIPKFAKKQDVEILAKQAKMFQPLDIKE